MSPWLELLSYFFGGRFCVEVLIAEGFGAVAAGTLFATV
jgi:hypothetical protein